MAKSETHDQMIEAICDYRKGWTNIHSATKELEDFATSIKNSPREGAK